MSMWKRKKVQILSREELRLRRWDFGLVPSERSLETVGKFARFHIISRDNHIDLFPKTSVVEKMAILKIKKTLIYSRERTAQSGGFLTSIWSNRATSRLFVCFPREMSSHRNCGLNSVWRIWIRTGLRRVRLTMPYGTGLRRSTGIG